MKNIYLCGHTGSMNRGCEAIVVSTSHILNMLGVEKKNLFLFSFDKTYDEQLGLNSFVNIIPYPTVSFFNRFITSTVIRIEKKGIICDNNFLGKMLKRSNTMYYKNVINSVANNSIILTIGGDTYCCSKPYKTYAFNELLLQKKIPNVFYGCSIDSSTLEKKEMCEDINKYWYIITRESYSKKTFEGLLLDKSKMLYACDPAFQLPMKKTKFPKGFLKKNTVGINLSPLVFSNYKNENDIMYQNIYELIDYILEKTDMHVSLIPHVYNIQNVLQDYYVLSIVYKKYQFNERVSIIDKELSCTELKYIISNCRFFIGARTHATIAAYSTAVPTIVLSYSVKSRGIARDLFDEEERYLLKWNEINHSNEIKKLFINTLLKNEDKILKRYNKILPNYKKTIIETTKKMLERLNYENE